MTWPLNSAWDPPFLTFWKLHVKSSSETCGPKMRFSEEDSSDVHQFGLRSTLYVARRFDHSPILQWPPRRRRRGVHFYQFAHHTKRHPHAENRTAADMQENTKAWLRELAPLARPEEDRRRYSRNLALAFSYIVFVRHITFVLKRWISRHRYKYMYSHKRTVRLQVEIACLGFKSNK